MIVCHLFPLHRSYVNPLENGTQTITGKKLEKQHKKSSTLTQLYAKIQYLQFVWHFFFACFHLIHSKIANYADKSLCSVINSFIHAGTLIYYTHLLMDYSNQVCCNKLKRGFSIARCARVAFKRKKYPFFIPDKCECDFRFCSSCRLFFEKAAIFFNVLQLAHCASHSQKIGHKSSRQQNKKLFESFFLVLPFDDIFHFWHCYSFRVILWLFSHFFVSSVRHSSVFWLGCKLAKAIK